MHQEFKNEFEKLGLRLSEVEHRIECPKNYLSQFINGTRELPNKWEVKIRTFLAAINKAVEKIEAPTPKLELLKPWVKLMEDYCKTLGMDPESLIEDHKNLKKKISELSKAVKNAPHTQINDVANNPPKTNHTINTMSNWAEENRKKKLGLK